MACNVEIKARLTDRDAVEARAAQLSDSGPALIEQDDTFYPSATGRLKLRRFADGSGELIYYERDDTAGPKGSFYLVTPQADPDSLDASLQHAIGLRGRVRKQRTLYLIGRTRVHLDRVEHLGDHLELEVVMADGESLDHGVAEAERLCALLGIAPDDLIEGAYIDLLDNLARA